MAFIIRQFDGSYAFTVLQVISNVAVNGTEKFFTDSLLENGLAAAFRYKTNALNV